MVMIGGQGRGVESPPERSENMETSEEQGTLFRVPPDPAAARKAAAHANALGAAAAAAAGAFTRETHRQDPPDPTEDRAGLHRAADYETSTAAALKEPGRRTSQRVRIGQEFYDHPAGLTDEEACDLAGVPWRSSPWKRTGELRDLGYLEDTGETRATTSGSAAKVWRMTAVGRAAWEVYVLTED